MAVTLPKNIGAARALQSAFVGAFAGSLIVSFCYAFGVSELNGANYYFSYGVAPTVTIFLFAFVFWFFGIIIFAFPLWYLIRRTDRAHWIAAASMGALLTFAVTFGLSTGNLELVQRPPDAVFSIAGPGGPIILDHTQSAQAWSMAFQESLYLGAEGALVGIIARWFAYRRRLGSTPSQ